LLQTSIRQILTRTSGFLKTVSSHSLQPYRGCALGNSLCGVGCYVQHNAYLTLGQPWGSFVEARTNAADAVTANRGDSRFSDCRHRARLGVDLVGQFLLTPFDRRKGCFRPLFEIHPRRKRFFTCAGKYRDTNPALLLDLLANIDQLPCHLSIHRIE